MADLLGRIAVERAAWDSIVARYRVQISFGVFLNSWNRGFELSVRSMERLSALGVPVGFDIYADAEAD